MWNEIFRRWIDGLFGGCRGTNRRRRRRKEGAGETEHSAGRGPDQGQAGVEAVKEVIPDDLTVIKGSGQASRKSCGPLGS